MGLLAPESLEVISATALSVQLPIQLVPDAAKAHLRQHVLFGSCFLPRGFAPS